MKYSLVISVLLLNAVLFLRASESKEIDGIPSASLHALRAAVIVHQHKNGKPGPKQRLVNQQADQNIQESSRRKKDCENWVCDNCCCCFLWCSPVPK